MDTACEALAVCERTRPHSTHFHANDKDDCPQLASESEQHELGVPREWLCSSV